MLVKDAMTPAWRVFMLSEDERLNYQVEVSVEVEIEVERWVREVEVEVAR